MIDDVGRKHRWKQSNTGDCKEDGADSHKAGKGATAGSKFYTRDRKSTFKVQKEKIDMKANNKHDDREG